MSTGSESVETQFLPDDDRDFLKLEYLRRNSRRPYYSKRAFARDLAMSPSSLVDYLNGKIGFSKARIGGLASFLGLSEEQVQHWQDVATLRFSKNAADRDEAQIRIEARRKALGCFEALEVFELLSEWTYWAYIELLDMNIKFQDDKVAADFLGITRRHQKKIKGNLIKHEFLKLSTEGHYFPTGKLRVLGNMQASEAVKKYHSDLIRRAHESIFTQDVPERFLSSLTLTLRKEDLPEVGRLIEKKLIEILTPYASKQSRDSVYACTFQLYDLLKK